MNTLPDAIMSIVQRSRGRLFCRKQAFRAGFSDGSLDRWLRADLIERLAPGWYRVVGDVVPPDQMLWLAADYLRLSTGPAPVLTGVAALARYGVDGFRMDGQPTVLIGHGDRVCIRTTPFQMLHADVGAIPTQLVGGHRLATPARALADLRRGSHPISGDDLVEAVDRTRNRLRLSVPDLMEEWAVMERHPGATALLQLARRGVFDCESGGERDALATIFSRCTAPPDCQVVLLDGIRVDFAYLFANLVIEYYGGVHDGKADSDATRVMALQLMHFLVIVLTKSMLRDAARTAAHIDDVHRRREAQVLAGTLERAAIPVQPRRRVPLRTLVPVG